MRELAQGALAAAGVLLAEAVAGGESAALPSASTAEAAATELVLCAILQFIEHEPW